MASIAIDLTVRLTSFRLLLLKRLFQKTNGGALSHKRLHSLSTLHRQDTLKTVNETFEPLNAAISNHGGHKSLSGRVFKLRIAM